MSEALSRFQGYANTTNFYTDSLSYNIEEGLKAKDKKYYVTGYMTSDDFDTVQEMVPEEEFAQILEQLKSRSVKLDLEHSHFDETFQDPEGEIAYGKIIDAKIVQEDGKTKIWIKAQLNEHHKRFDEVWSSIQDGYLDGFSIAWRAEKHTILRDNQEMYVLRNVWIKNVALTGVPVNTDSTMENSFYKSLRAATMKTEGKKGEGKDGAHAHTDNDPLGEHKHPEMEKMLQEELRWIGDRIDYCHERIDEVRKMNIDVMSDEVKAVAAEGYKSHVAKLTTLQTKMHDIFKSNSSVDEPASNNANGGGTQMPEEEKKTDAPANDADAADKADKADKADGDKKKEDGQKSLAEGLKSLMTVVEGMKAAVDGLVEKQKETDKILSQDGFKSLANPAAQKTEEEAISPLSLVR